MITVGSLKRKRKIMQIVFSIISSVSFCLLIVFLVLQGNMRQTDFIASEKFDVAIIPLFFVASFSLLLLIGSTFRYIYSFDADGDSVIVHRTLVLPCRLIVNGEVCDVAIGKIYLEADLSSGVRLTVLFDHWGRGVTPSQVRFSDGRPSIDLRSLPLV